MDDDDDDDDVLEPDVIEPTKKEWSGKEREHAPGGSS
jgi:hypothetical protein